MFVVPGDSRFGEQWAVSGCHLVCRASEKLRGFCEQEIRSCGRSEGGNQDREDRKNTGCSLTRIEEEETQRDQRAK